MIKLQLESFYTTDETKGRGARAVTKEINEVEGLDTVNERVAQNRFRCFNEGDTCL